MKSRPSQMENLQIKMSLTQITNLFIHLIFGYSLNGYNNTSMNNKRTKQWAIGSVEAKELGSGRSFRVKERVKKNDDARKQEK